VKSLSSQGGRSLFRFLASSFFRHFRIWCKLSVRTIMWNSIRPGRPGVITLACDDRQPGATTVCLLNVHLQYSKWKLISSADDVHRLSGVALTLLLIYLLMYLHATNGSIVGVWRSQWSSCNMPDCGVRGHRFESYRGQLCLARQPLRSTVLGTGCTPLLQCLDRLSFSPFVGRKNKYQL